MDTDSNVPGTAVCLPASPKFEDDLAPTGVENKGLVPPADAPLSPEDAATVDTLKRSLLSPADRRLTSMFLQLDDYPSVDHVFGNLMSRLLLECLPRFVESLGGRIIWTARLEDDDDGELVAPRRQSITLDGIERVFQRDGFFFIRTPTRRVVLFAARNHEQDSLLSIRSGQSPSDFFKAWMDYTKAHNYLRGRAFYADGQLIERETKNTLTWDDVLLPDSAKRVIRLHIEDFLARRGQLRQFGIKPKRGLLLAGPPGTGKTSAARVLENTLAGVSKMWVTPRLVSSPESFAGILRVARMVAPTLLILEDLDLFAEERDEGGGMTLGELMNQLDGAEDLEDVVTIATTNRLTTVEKALRNRPGRFDRTVTFGPMDEACRHRMLTKLLDKAIIEPDDFALLVRETDGSTGAQIRELANTIYLYALAETQPANSPPGDTPRDAAAQADSETPKGEALSSQTGHISALAPAVDAPADGAAASRAAPGSVAPAQRLSSTGYAAAPHDNASPAGTHHTNGRDETATQPHLATSPEASSALGADPSGPPLAIPPAESPQAIPLKISHELITTALAEVRIERRRPVGFRS